MKTLMLRVKEGLAMAFQNLDINIDIAGFAAPVRLST